MLKLLNILSVFLVTILLIEGLDEKTAEVTGYNKLPPITDEQLRAFSEELLKTDSNVAQPNFNLQGKQGAPMLPLFETLDENILDRPTYLKLIRLLDNYDRKVETPETVTQEEIKEMEEFVNAVLNTTLMRKVHEFLLITGRLGPEDDFRKIVFDLWFTLYPRVKNVQGSSGFEHVFVGEVKDNSISGLHNWIQYYTLEKDGQVQYQGFITYLPLLPPVSLLKYKFMWSPYSKPSNTMFIGTSPEFEMAIYTTCFLTRPNSACPLRLGGKTVNVYTYSHNYKGQQYIGSAYPSFS